MKLPILGIIGGGQLGRMLSFSAKKMGLKVVILDPTPNSPAAQVSDEQIIGELSDPEYLKTLAEKCDVITYEIEHIDTSALKEIQNHNIQIFPSPDVLKIIQNKYSQKLALEKAKVPTAPFMKVENSSSLNSLIKSHFQYPVAQKTCTGGYDGRGVQILRSESDLDKAFPVDSFIEKQIHFKKELAVNVAQNSKGEIKCHPVSEMVFNQEANICDLVLAPAQINKTIQEKAIEVSKKAIQALGSGAIGIFGVELFLTEENEILVNEIAPRPHNSGHYSIEGCLTSQYEQHLRAILNWPLGSTKMIKPSAMINILGDNQKNQKLFDNWNSILEVQNVSIHWYGKKENRPMRKMGHITLLAETNEELDDKIKLIRSLI